MLFTKLIGDLRTGVAVMNQSARHTAVGVIAAPQRHLQRRGDHSWRNHV
jgi:hypothetical protein